MIDDSAIIFPVSRNTKSRHWPDPVLVGARAGSGTRWPGKPARKTKLVHEIARLQSFGSPKTWIPGRPKSSGTAQTRESEPSAVSSPAAHHSSRQPTPMITISVQGLPRRADLRRRQGTASILRKTRSPVIPRSFLPSSHPCPTPPPCFRPGICSLQPANPRQPQSRRIGSSPQAEHEAPFPRKSS